MTAVAEADVLRYARQMILPEVGKPGQEKLKSARILCVGAGGLGSPAALYLAAAGVGALGLVDGDAVDLTNLHRQILHATPDLGKKKVVSAREKLSALNPNVRVVEHAFRLTAANADVLLADYDLVLDGSDNFETRYAVNDAAARAGKNLIWGAVLRWEGQVSSVLPGKSACYRCLFPEPPQEGAASSCADAGILGPVAGVIGCLMAAEALKTLLGTGTSLAGRLLSVDVRTLAFRGRATTRRADCPACSGGVPSAI